MSAGVKEPSVDELVRTLRTWMSEQEAAQRAAGLLPVLVVSECPGVPRRRLAETMRALEARTPEAIRGRRRLAYDLDLQAARADRLVMMLEEKGNAESARRQRQRAADLRARAQALQDEATQHELEDA